MPEFDPDSPPPDEVLFKKIHAKDVDPLWVEKMRPLGLEDLPDLAKPAVKPPQRGIMELKHKHHAVARYLASGKSDVDVAFMCGYSPNHIWLLKKDPGFQELLAHYEAQVEQVFYDNIEQMKEIGGTVLNEITKRLEEAPEGWSNRELTELSKQMNIDVLSASRGGIAASSGNGPAINVTFVNAPQAKSPHVIEHDLPDLPGGQND